MTSAQSAEWRHSSLRPLPTLPGDIIAEVCKQIVATPLHQYDLSLTRGPHSQWCVELRFRKSLPLVSKLWWQPATRGLYKHIVIRRFRQIPALARTLSSNGAGINLGGLVRKITLHQCLVVLPDWNVKPQDLRTVFERCVALEELSFQRHPDYPDTVTESEDDVWDLPQPLGANPLWIFPNVVFPALQARASTALRRLDLASFDCWDIEKLEVALHSLILASPRLISLALPIYRAPTPKFPTLEVLEELYLDFLSHTPESSSRAVRMWDLPRLRSLTVVLNELPIVVLEKLGRTLTYLHLSSDTPCKGTGLDRLSQLCPALEHLVFYPQAHSADGICTLLDTSVEPFRRLRYLPRRVDQGRRGHESADGQRRGVPRRARPGALCPRARGGARLARGHALAGRPARHVPPIRDRAGGWHPLRVRSRRLDGADGLVRAARRRLVAGRRDVAGTQ
ncbi:hypothetical protein LXA43DRAFT_1032247 [Ganoderma leucocontextum]|nr:hypothetical protein LXA43DRAFT_1032247 [Ganoderma leucocontextum]